MSTTLLSADIQLIHRLLPHRYPFLMVDRVEDINGYHSARGVKNVTMNEPHFQGHFPGQPVMPGVLIIEGMAQTAAVMVGVALQLADRHVQVYFMGMESVKFRRMVVPGDVLEMQVKTLRGRPGARVWRFEGQARVRGEVTSEGVFSAVMDRAAK